MNKNTWTFLIALFSYTALFYQQSAGINFLIFNLVLISIILIRNISLLRNLPFISFALLSILTSVSITLYGTGFAVIMNVLALTATAGFAMNQSVSLPFAGFQTIFSYCAAPLFAGIDFLERKKERKNQGAVVPGFFFSLLVIFVFFLFLFLYRIANPQFKELTDQINLDFISIGWIFFTLGGAWLLYGYLFPRYTHWFSLFDSQFLNYINSSPFHEINEQDVLKMKPERNSAILLFSLLIIMLLTVLALDFDYFFISKSLPQDQTYSESVHQGVYTLIFSVVLAIALIVFYFRGFHNYEDKSSSLKTLAIIWVVLNGLLILSGGLKNQLYIEQYSLTYKRIGVYVFLTLTFSGLIFTLIKIIQKKTIWYMLRANSWICLILLSMMTLINWDKVIAQYNICCTKITVDKFYILNLSSSVIPELESLKASIIKKEKKEYDEEVFLMQLEEKKKLFLENQENKSWRSWNLDDQMVEEFLLK